MQKEQKEGAVKLPDLAPDAVKGLRLFWEIYQGFYDEVQKETMHVVEKIPTFAALLKSMDPADMARQQAEDRKRTDEAVMSGRWEPWLKNLQVQGVMYAGMGIEFSAWTDLLMGVRGAMIRHLARACGKDQERFIVALNGMWDFFDITISRIGDSYMDASAQTIRKQEAAITELSTPVLKVRERFLILPIIGILDTQRARQVTEALLQSIRANRAKVVVMDITGVPMVDSKVANHLVQTVEAARLMGATVIITGVSPEIAQTLVALGAELPNVKTFGDLQGGIEEGDTLLGLRIEQQAGLMGA